MKPFAFLRPWARTRRIVSGRRVIGHMPNGAPIIHYTTPEAAEADFGPSRMPEYMEALRVFNLMSGAMASTT